MNRAVFWGAMCTGLVLGANCSQPGPATTTQSSGGSSGGATTSAGGSGGATGNGGSSASGGVTNNGGSSASGGAAGNGGSSAAGGATGNGGSGGASGGTASGGTTANGGTSAGGTTSKGGTTGTTGGVQGTGGSQGTSGTTAVGGTKGTGGTTGSGGVVGSGGVPATGGSSGTVDVTTVVPDMDGFYWEGTCANGTQSGLDCPLADDTTPTGCPNSTASDYNTRGAFKNKTLAVKGTTGTQYTINFEVRGVVGTRCYTGGTPAAAALGSNPETTNNGWYVGGTPTDSKWNTYEIHVSPAVPGAANVYYLNAFPNTPSGWCEKHETFPMKYTASFPVMGGGTIKFTIHDSNCLGQQNCGGPDSQPSCASPRKIDVSGMPKSTFTQPVTNVYGSTTFYPQWLLFDVTSVTSP